MTGQVKLSLGSWVEIVNHTPHYNGVIGYIEEMDDDDSAVCIRTVRHPKTGKFFRVLWMDSYHVRLMPDQLELQDVDALIEMALINWDEQMFHHYCQRRATIGQG